MVSLKYIVGHATVTLLAASDVQAGVLDDVPRVKIACKPVMSTYKHASLIKAEYKQAYKSGALEFSLPDLISVLHAVDAFSGSNKFIKTTGCPSELVKIIYERLVGFRKDTFYLATS